MKTNATNGERKKFISVTRVYFVICIEFGE